MSTPTHDSGPLAAGEIEFRAYTIYCARGCVDGHDVDDWLEAERQLLAEADTAPDPGETSPAEPEPAKAGRRGSD